MSIEKHKLQCVSTRTGTNAISCATVAELVSSNNSPFSKIIIVDCRFPYEYEGGHIKGAINLQDENQLHNMFLELPMHLQITTCIILHCEFSQKRGVDMFHGFRKLDREVHGHAGWPKLSCPDLYLMEGGYREFYQKHALLCDPMNYVSMDHEDFQCQQVEQWRKRHSSNRTARLMRSRSMNDLRSSPYSKAGRPSSARGRANIAQVSHPGTTGLLNGQGSGNNFHGNSSSRPGSRGSNRSLSFMSAHDSTSATSVTSVNGSPLPLAFQQPLHFHDVFSTLSSNASSTSGSPSALWADQPNHLLNSSLSTLSTSSSQSSLSSQSPLTSSQAAQFHRFSIRRESPTLLSFDETEEQQQNLHNMHRRSYPPPRVKSTQSPVSSSGRAPSTPLLAGSSVSSLSKPTDSDRGHEEPRQLFKTNTSLSSSSSSSSPLHGQTDLNSGSRSHFGPSNGAHKCSPTNGNTSNSTTISTAASSSSSPGTLGVSLSLAPSSSSKSSTMDLTSSSMSSSSVSSGHAHPGASVNSLLPPPAMGLGFQRTRSTGSIRSLHHGY